MSQPFVINTVAGLSYVDRLQARIHGLKQLTPSLIIGDTRSKGHRIARTNDSQFAGRHVAGEILIAAKSLRIGAQVNSGIIKVLLIEIWNADPPQLFVVLG